MTIYSAQFLLFLLLGFIIYYSVQRIMPGKQWYILLILSLVFYYFSGVNNFIYIFSTAVTTWIGAKISYNFYRSYQVIKKDKTIDRNIRKKYKSKMLFKKRVVLIVVLLINFGILGYIKYWPTFWNELSPFFTGTSSELSQLLLPLGISFYTFQSMGYMIDIHNDKYVPESNFFKFLLFVSFFPQLIQGPINRFDKLAIQLYEIHTINLIRIKRAFILFCFGALKKFAIADLLSPSVSVILDSTNMHLPGSIISLGIFLYAIQQYADFSGGIDMVLAVAELFGIKMAQNFRQPYFSTSLGDFWRRWHITLGAWMRDYVFYPFALTKTMINFGKWSGTHFGKHFGRALPACIGNLIVFFLVGIWHGPQLHFILWGLYNGIIIALTDLCHPIFQRILQMLKINIRSKRYHIFLILLTFFIVNVAGYFDRIEDVHKSLVYMWNTLFYFQANAFHSYYHSMIFPKMHGLTITIVCVSLILVFINSVFQEKGIDTYTAILRKNIFLQCMLFYFVFILIVVGFMIAPAGAGGFMYEHF